MSGIAQNISTVMPIMLNATANNDGAGNYFGDDALVADESGQPNPFTPVFWGVNAFILCILLTVCAWCCYFGGKDNLTQWANRRRETDLEYQRTLRERLEREKAAKRDSPQKRMARLKRSFLRSKVLMVVKNSDIIECDESERNAMEPVHHVVEPSEDNNNISEDQHLENNNNQESTVESSTEESSDGLSSSDDSQVEAMEQGGEAIANNLQEEQVDNDDSEIPSGYLILRPPRNGPKKGQKVPNCCAVCLCPYEKGETVVWSPNPECKHCFHVECITDWLVKMQDGTPCPCCRQEFTDLEEHRKERKIKWAAGNTFNFGSIGI